MMPGEMNLPVTSMTSAPAGIVTLAPSAAILPSRRTMVPFGIVPRVTVTSVAPLSAMTPGRGWRLPAEARDRERDEGEGDREEERPRSQMTAIHSKPPGDLSAVAREASEGGRR